MGFMFFWIALMTLFIMHGIFTEPARLFVYALVGSVIWFATMYGVYALLIYLDGVQHITQDPIPPFMNAFWYDRDQDDREIFIVVAVWGSLLIGRNIMAGLYTARALRQLAGHTV